MHFSLSFSDLFPPLVVVLVIVYAPGMVGHSIDLIAPTNEKDAHKCMQCKRVLKDGVVACPGVGKGAHATCSSCYDQLLLTNNGHCRKCDQVLKPTDRIHCPSDINDELRIKCFSRDPRCTWTGMFYARYSHLKYECEWREVSCYLDCGVKFPFAERAQHADACLLADVECPRGGAFCRVLLRRNLDIHEGYCTNYTCPECDEQGTRQQLESFDHKRSHILPCVKKEEDEDEEAKEATDDLAALPPPHGHRHPPLPPVRVDSLNHDLTERLRIAVNALASTTLELDRLKLDLVDKDESTLALRGERDDARKALKRSGVALETARKWSLTLQAQLSPGKENQKRGRRTVGTPMEI
ncbi:hypothetical protein RQP46_001180 [Phenoliferia psychrophenolica]